MIELTRTNDLVLLDFVQALLRDGGVETIVLDTHASVIEGTAGAIPRRLMVAADDAARARMLLDQAGVEIEPGS